MQEKDKDMYVMAGGDPDRSRHFATVELDNCCLKSSQEVRMLC